MLRQLLSLIVLAGIFVLSGCNQPIANNFTEVSVTADKYEPDDEFSDASPIIVGSIQSHTLAPAGDQDWYSLDVESTSDTYTIQTSDLTDSADTVIYLYDTNGTSQIASNDDYNSTWASRIEHSFASTGTYYFKVDDWDGGVGNYSITVEPTGTGLSRVDTPSFSPDGGTFTNSQDITIVSGTSGALIAYTTDGSTPTSSHGTIYSAPFSIVSTTTIKAVAYKSGMTASEVASATFTKEDSASVDTPTISPDGGSFSTSQRVTIVCGTTGATIRYTTDGSTPTSSNGIIYSGPIDITSTTTIRAIAYTSGMTDSGVASAAFTQESIGTVAMPTFSPNGGTFVSSQYVTISCSTAGATIRYTTDGSAPTSAHGVIGNSAQLTSTTTLKAIAYKSGMVDSGVASASFTKESTFTVTLNKEGGTGGSSSVEATYGGPMPSASAPTRSGYTFGGYFTSPNGSGTQYYTSSMGSARSWDQTSDDTLHAKWTPIPDTTPPSVSYFRIANGDTYSSSRAVSYSLSVFGATYMRFLDDNPGGWTEWYEYASTFTGGLLPSGDGTKRVYAEFKDDSDNVVQVYDDIILDTTSPVVTSFEIYGGHESTHTSSVSVNMSVSGATSMRFRNSGGSWSSWYAYSGSKAWNIVPSENSYRYVYAEFQDQVGNVTSVSDSIYYDAVRQLRITAEYLDVNFDGDGLGQGSGEVRITFFGYDTSGSFFGIYDNGGWITIGEGIWPPGGGDLGSAAVSMSNAPGESYRIRFSLGETDDDGASYDWNNSEYFTYFGDSGWGIGGTRYIWSGDANSAGPEGSMYFRIEKID